MYTHIPGVGAPLTGEICSTQNKIINNISQFLFLSLLLLTRCILSLSQAFLNNSELKIFGKKTTKKNHSKSVFILLRGTAMLQSHSQQTNENYPFLHKILLSIEFFLLH